MTHVFCPVLGGSWTSGWDITMVNRGQPGDGPEQHSDAGPQRPGWGGWLTSPYLLLTGTALFWSGNFIAGRAGRAELPPMALNFWRWTLALAILTALTAGPLWQNRLVIARHWRLLLGLGLTGIVAFHGFTYTALQTTEAINAVLVLSATPLAIVVVAWLMFRDTITALSALGIVVAMIGAIAVIARGDIAVLSGLQANPGDLWMLAAALSWAVYSVLLKRRPEELPPMVLLTATVMVGVVLQLPIYLYTLSVGQSIVPTVSSIATIAYVAVFASVLAYIFWNRGVREVGPSRAGVFIHLMPLFSAVLAVVFLGERIAWYHLAGGGLIVLGIVMASSRQR